MKTENKPWWETIDFSQITFPRNSVEQLATFSLITSALKDNLCVYEHIKDGNLLISSGEFLKKISSLGGRVVSCSINDVKDMTIANTSDQIVVWNDAVLSISFDNSDWIYVKAVSLNKELITKIKDVSEEYITQKTKGKVYVFVSGEGGPELRQISGKAGIELERENYTQKVLDDFDHVVKDLQSPNPCAKLIIADGEPGTGKTFLVRGITNAVDGATFVLVQPSMISDIMSPQFIPVLMDNHANDQPIVFIIEDADACLVERGGDNMHSISSLLNLGAGIFGDLFDLRIIATTNAKKIEMDKAITRNGRCCRYLEVGALPREQAQKVFNRLTGTDKKELQGGQKSYTLADVYYAARNENWDEQEKTPITKTKDGIGF